MKSEECMAGINYPFRKVRRFLFSNLNKQFLIFLFFLFLSSIFWLIMTLNGTYEKEIKILKEGRRVEGIDRVAD